MTRLRDLLEQKDGLRDLDGWLVRQSLIELKRSVGVFEGNSRALQAFLGHGDTSRTPDALEMLDFSNREGLGEFLDEADRLFHNFLAAAESLKAHAGAIQRAHLPAAVGDADTDDTERADGPSSTHR